VRRFRRATLWVLAGNARARAFYETVGWNADGHERHRMLRGTDVHEVRYQTALAGPADTPRPARRALHAAPCTPRPA